MTDSAQTLPVPEAVGELYDRLTLSAMNDGTFNPHVHIGFWDRPDSEASLEEAVARLAEVVIDRLAVDDSAHVLDLGCGVGGPALNIVARADARSPASASARSRSKPPTGWRRRPGSPTGPCSAMPMR
nr:putative D-glucose O-methyltransferase domain protein [uncultured bacterium]